MKLFTTAALALALAAGAAAGADAQNQTYNPDGHHGGDGGGAQHPGGGHPDAGHPGASHTDAGAPGGRYQGPPPTGGHHTPPPPPTPAPSPAGNGAQHGNGSGQHGNGDNDHHGHGGDGDWNGGQHGPGDHGWNNDHGWNGGHGWNGWNGNQHFRDHPLRDRDHGRGWYDPGRFAPHYWAHQRFHIGFWRRPAGWYARSWTYGMFLPFGWYQPDYYLDWSEYDLPAPPVGCEWVRQGADAVLVDVYTGEVLSVYQGLFW